MRINGFELKDIPGNEYKIKCPQKFFKDVGMAFLVGAKN